MTIGISTNAQGGRVDWRPDEIATRRFSLRLFGFNSREVRRALLEISATLDHAKTELTREILICAGLEKSLEAAKRTSRELRVRLVAAQAMVAVCECLGRALAGDHLSPEVLTQLLQAARATAEGRGDTGTRPARSSALQGAPPRRT